MSKYKIGSGLNECPTCFAPDDGCSHCQDNGYCELSDPLTECDDFAYFMTDDNWKLLE